MQRAQEKRETDQGDQHTGHFVAGATAFTFRRLHGRLLSWVDGRWTCFIPFCFPKGKPNKKNLSRVLSNARPGRLPFHPREKRLINLPMSSGPPDGISQFPAVPGDGDIDSRPLEETGYFVVVELENDEGGAGATRRVHTMVLTGDIKIRPPQAIDHLRPISHGL